MVLINLDVLEVTLANCGTFHWRREVIQALMTFELRNSGGLSGLACNLPSSGTFNVGECRSEFAYLLFVFRCWHFVSDVM